MIGFFFILICFFLYGYECFRSNWKGVTISSFWVFTFFYLLAYPFKYILITEYLIEYQAPIKPDDETLLLALILSFSFWTLIYLFRSRTYLSLLNADFNGITPPIKTLEISKVKVLSRPFPLGNVVLFFFIAISAYSFYNLWVVNGYQFSVYYSGNHQNEARVGGGHLFLLNVLYFKAIVIILFFIKKKTNILLLSLFFISIIISFYEMILLGTRRPIFLLIYAYFLYLVINKENKISVLILALIPAFMLISSPIGQFLKYNFLNFIAGDSDIAIDTTFYLTIIGSTFEGIEHLANFLNKINIAELLLGVDQGIAWAWNSGLAFIPRIFWESKPLIYGSVAQQYFLYPEMYTSGAGQTTLPSGIIVDSMYGFGVFSMLILSYFYAKLFSIMDKVLFLSKKNYGYLLLVSSIIYINMFNLVRGGSGIISFVVMIIIFAFIVDFLNRSRLINRR
jgi:hypothetical protein